MSNVKIVSSGHVRKISETVKLKFLTQKCVIKCENKCVKQLVLIYETEIEFWEQGCSLLFVWLWWHIQLKTFTGLSSGVYVIGHTEYGYWFMTVTCTNVGCMHKYYL